MIEQRLCVNNMKLKRLISYILVFLLLTISTVIPVQSVSITRLNERIVSESAILIDADTGQILYEKDMFKQLHPASITKVMTALLALENGDMEAEITVTNSALINIEPTAASIHLIPREKITLENAMYGMAIVSAADASNVIAEHIGGSVSNFIKLMNDRAKELGALNTNFANAHGMPNPNHYTTAYDMALISMAAVNTPGFNEIFGARSYRMPPTNARENSRIFRTQNKMITGDFRYSGLISSKTGWTQRSRHTFFAAAKRDDRTLVGILIRSQFQDDKYKDMTMMLDYGFDNFDSISLSIEELNENSSFTPPAGYELIDFTIHEDFTSLIPKQFTKDDIIIKYIPEIIETEEEPDDTEESDDTLTESVNAEISLPVTVTISLNVSPLWPGIPGLGQVPATARLIKLVVEDEAEDEAEDEEDNEAVDEEPEPPEQEEPQEPPDQTPQEQQEQEPQEPQATDKTYINEDNLLETSSLWLWILKNTGALIVAFAILLCYSTIKKRRR